jgi:hypothetical protein
MNDEFRGPLERLRAIESRVARWRLADGLHRQFFGVCNSGYRCPGRPAIIIPGVPSATMGRGPRDDLRLPNDRQRLLEQFRGQPIFGDLFDELAPSLPGGALRP